MLIGQVTDDLSVDHNLGLVDIEARKHVVDIVNATDPHQRVFVFFHSHVFKFVQPQILLRSPACLEPILDDCSAAAR